VDRIRKRLFATMSYLVFVERRAGKKEVKGGEIQGGWCTPQSKREKNFANLNR